MGWQIMSKRKELTSVTSAPTQKFYICVYNVYIRAHTNI